MGRMLKLICLAVALMSPHLCEAKFSFKKLFQSFFLMPHVGYEQGKWESSYDDSVSSSQTYGDTIGIRYGTLLGMRIKKYFFVAVSADWGNYTWRYNKADNFYYDDDFIHTSAKRSSLGAMLGVQLTKRSIFWFGYDFQNELELSENHDPERPAPTYDGTAIKFGFSTNRKKAIFSLFYHIDSYDTVLFDGQEEPIELPGRFNRFNLGEFKHSSFVLSISWFWGKMKGK